MDAVGYLEALDEPRRSHMRAVDALVREELPSREVAIVHGMIGYGPYRYRYASGREGETALISLASQKRHISLYVNCVGDTGYLAEAYAGRLGKASCGKSCIRFRSLDELDVDALRQLLREADRIGPAAVAE